MHTFDRVRLGVSVDNAPLSVRGRGLKWNHDQCELDFLEQVGSYGVEVTVKVRI